MNKQILSDIIYEINKGVSDMKQFDELKSTIITRFVIYSFVKIFFGFMFLPPLRKIFLEVLGAKVGNSTNIMAIKFFNEHRTGFSNLEIGDDCFIGDETLIDLYGSVKIENQVTIAQRVNILSHTNVGYSDHPLQKLFPKKIEGVIIKKGAVVGSASTILPGVTIGEKSFVAAGSVVTSNVPPNTLVAGVPAKTKKKLD